VEGVSSVSYGNCRSLLWDFFIDSFINFLLIVIIDALFYVCIVVRMFAGNQHTLMLMDIEFPLGGLIKASTLLYSTLIYFILLQGTQVNS